MRHPYSNNHSEKFIEPLQQGRLVEQSKEMMHGSDNDRRIQSQVDFSIRDLERFEQHYGLEAAERLKQRLADLMRVELDVVASAMPSEANMGEGDAHVLRIPPPLNRRSTETVLQITVLSDDQELMPRLERSLRALRADFTFVETIDEANELINSGQPDLTIVDIQGADGWPGLVFQLFDERAANDVVVVLCRDADDTRHHRKRALHAVDIFPSDAIDDHRFQCVIQAALLRADAVPSDERGHGIAPAA